MKFYTELTLPESKSTCKVSQLTVQDYIELNRFLQNDNNKHITDCFQQIIKKYTDYSDTISLVDGVAVLLFIRAISVGPSITGKKDGAKVEITFGEFLEKLLDLNFSTREMKLNGRLSFILRTPFSLTDIDYERFIYGFKTTGQNIATLTVDQQVKVFNNLPASTVSAIHEYVENIDKQLNKLDIYIASEKIEMSLLNNSLLEYVKFFYTENIINIQQKLIKISQTTQLDTSYLLSLPPAEINIFFNSIIEEEKRQNNQGGSNNASIAGIRGRDA